MTEDDERLGDKLHGRVDADVDSVEDVRETREINPEDPTLEDALDGLMAATNYCDDVGLHELALEIGESYQRLGESAPEEDWE